MTCPHWLALSVLACLQVALQERFMRSCRAPLVTVELGGKLYEKREARLASRQREATTCA
jgi:hypothetical protein